MNTESLLIFLGFIGRFLWILLIVFGGLLLAALLLLALLLFLPFYYKVEVRYREDDFYLDSRIRFLLGFLNAKISYTDKLFYRVRLLFFPLFSSLKKKKEEKKKKERKPEKEPKEEKKAKEDIKAAAKVIEEEREKVTKNPEMKSATSKSAKEYSKNEADLEDRIEAIEHKISDFGKKFEDRKQKTVSTCLEVIEKKDAIFHFFQAEGTLEGIRLLVTESFHLLKAIFPKKISGRLRFGTGDVYTEGQYLTYLCLIYGLYADSLEIEPEWEEKVLEADIEFYGRISIFTILRICIKVYFDSNFNKLRRSIEIVRMKLGF